MIDQYISTTTTTFRKSIIDKGIRKKIIRYTKISVQKQAKGISKEFMEEDVKVAKKIYSLSLGRKIYKFKNNDEHFLT